jgi:hypothetical protein
MEIWGMPKIIGFVPSLRHTLEHPKEDGKKPKDFGVTDPDDVTWINYV